MQLMVFFENIGRLASEDDVIQLFESKYILYTREV